MSASEVLHQWVRDPRSLREAPDAWTSALEALPALPPDVPRALLESVFDRFLDEAPQTLYRALPTLSDHHWAVLLEALGRCEDLEARVIGAASRRGRLGLEDAAHFMAMICSQRDALKCAEKVLASDLARSPAVLASCTEALGLGWPPPGMALAGVLSAAIGLGTGAQATTVLAQRAPDELLHLYRTIAPALPKDRRAALLNSIEGREPPLVSPPVASAPRFRKRQLTRRKSGPLPGSSAPDLLARVYAAPDDDAARAVYADSLLERQQPLGEFIQLQLARHAGRKGTLTKERLIFEEFGANLWPEHPCAVAKVNLAFHEVERGFPAVFPTSAVPSTELRKALAGLPGWRTLRVIHAWQDEVDLSALLPAQLPMLETLEDVGLATLERIGQASWPLRRLTATGTAIHKAVTGLPKLQELELSARTTSILSKMVSRPMMTAPLAIELLEPSGLLARLQRLVLRLHRLALRELLDAWAGLPSSLKQLEAHAFPSVRALLQRGPKGLELTVFCDGSGARSVAEELRGLGASALARVEVVLDAATPADQRAAIERDLKDALARFPNGALSDRVD